MTTVAFLTIALVVVVMILTIALVVVVMILTRVTRSLGDYLRAISR